MPECVYVYTTLDVCTYGWMGTRVFECTTLGSPQRCSSLAGRPKSARVQA